MADLFTCLAEEGLCVFSKVRHKDRMLSRESALLHQMHMRAHGAAHDRMLLHSHRWLLRGNGGIV